jgi:hypothetical protein
VIKCGHAKYPFKIEVLGRASSPSFVASGLARVGLRSGPNKTAAFCQVNRGVWFLGRFAPQRGQARSPQKSRLPEKN